jgi:maltooligosyltrehalose trehalohydrolase
MSGIPKEQFAGAVLSEGVARFRVWAPQAERLEVVFEGHDEAVALERAEDGYFVGTVRSPPSLLYRYRIDGQGPWPDPCSRYQPQGVHGPSQLVDASGFAWTDTQWRGTRMHGQVVYELHIGTFTREGTFDAAAEKLEYLRDLGVTMLEIMPVAECPGRWNWGYDGVQLYAPYHVYGEPDALRRFVDRAHALGLAVILDVVYNHLGPDGNYLKCYSPYYFSKRYRTDWGEALNFDDEHSRAVRDFVIGNACYWIREFHIDGFRLDATQSIFDSSEYHILAELVQRARAAALPRQIVFIAENEPQRGEHLRPVEAGGFDMDAMWNDDFHHAARVALTGSRDGYFRDYTGRAQEFVSCLRRGFLYQGQWYGWQKQARGSRLDRMRVTACVQFLQNHDQVGNTFVGTRIHDACAPASYRALIAVTLLAPQTPMLFMGQEFAASAPFKFFADHNEELGKVVHAGRREFVAQFRAYADPAVQALIPDPCSPDAFADSRLDWSEVDRHAAAFRLHRDLLRLRKSDPVVSRQDHGAIDAATLREHAFVVRWFDEHGFDRLLVVNLGSDLMEEPLAEPLLAPAPDREWLTVWSSEAPEYGGRGVAAIVGDGGRGAWRIQAQSTTLLAAQARRAISNSNSPSST